MTSIRTIRLVLAALVVGCSLIGCGGSGGSQGPGTGRAILTIIWPDRSRLIPIASNSIRVDILRGTTVFATQVLSRPPNGGPANARFDPLPLGDLTAVATAFPSSNGTGVAQAQASVGITIQLSSTTVFTVTMASTIDHVEINPPNPAALVGKSTQLSVTAKDSAGSVVLISTGKLEWTTADAAFATVDSAGKATGVAPTGVTPGPVQITVKETESGKIASTGFAVTSNVGVSISPPAFTLPIGDPKHFDTTVTNTSNTAVTWSVQEGAAGGSVTPSGDYTAPNTAGIYHLVATSVYDNSKKANATVTVESGNSDVTIK